jgi:hypothetical protein
MGMMEERAKGIIPSKTFLGVVGAMIGLATYVLLGCSISSITFKGDTPIWQKGVVYFIVWPGWIVDFLHLPPSFYFPIWFAFGPLLYVVAWNRLTIWLVPFIMRRMKK